MEQKNRIKKILGLLLIGILASAAWLSYSNSAKEENVFSGNGRIQAVEIDVAAKMAGRVREIFVREGDFVKAGQVLAYMDTDVLEAQLREANAKLLQAKSSVAISQSQLIQKESEKASAVAVVKQREAELELAKKRLARSSILVAEGAASQQEVDDDYARVQSAAATLDAAMAQAAAAEAAISTAREQVIGSQSTVQAGWATIERIEADIKDSALISPRDGRVQYRIVQPGEVVGAGGKVLNLIDLSDVYMTFFLPTSVAGRLAIGSEVRLVLDAAPQYIIPAKVSFISDIAQFTPKMVETAVEREKLMFRIRAQIPEQILKQHMTQVKTGLPGMAYIRIDASKPWPARLQIQGEDG